MENKQKKGRYFFFLICFFCLGISVCHTQTIEQAYNLRFLNGGSFQTPIAHHSTLFRIDTIQTTDGGFHPLQIKFLEPTLLIGPNQGWSAIPQPSDVCFLDWSRIVVLPADAEKKACTVTLNCKSEVDSLQFIVIALDKEENELYTDSLTIHPTTHLTDYSLMFRKKEARAVKILIRYNGSAIANEGRSIYMNRVKIRIGNQELNNLPITSLVQSNTTQLKTEAIIPFSFQDDAALANIHDWKNKKIIALGESTSGMQDLREVQIQLMKQLIRSENCKLIMLELPENMCLRWNLYLQGKHADIYEDELREELKYCVHNYTIFFEFLRWVRQYNAKANVPVRIAGINNIDDFDFRSRGNILLTDYLLKLSTNQQDSAYYSDAINQCKYRDVKEYIVQSQLSNTLREQDFQYLLFLMEEMIRSHSPDNKPWEKESDFDKVKRIEKVINICLSSTEKAVIIAPSDRINKRFLWDQNFTVPSDRIDKCYLWNPDLKPDFLGSYLSQKYGTQYHAVSLQIGERTCLMDSIAFYMPPDSLTLAFYKKNDIPLASPVRWEPPFPFAFERAGMDSQIPYFYYPSSQLPEGILGLRLYISDIWTRVPFKYCYIPSHFDALVFVREAKATSDLRIFFGGRYYLKKYVFNSIATHLDKLLEELKEYAITSK